MFNGSITVVDTASNSPQVVMLSGSGLSNAFTAIGIGDSGVIQQTATMLDSGEVLTTGGQFNNIPSANADLYDPSTGAFTGVRAPMITGTTVTGRYKHTATLLNDGRVLIVGGDYSHTPVPLPLASANIYDPTSETFTETGSMSAGRFFHTATMLPSGKVLVAGGQSVDASGNTIILSSAEVYDPATGSFSLTGSLNNAREQHTATLLANGKVLIAGGDNGSIGLVSTELYDPGTGAFTATGNLNTARTEHTANLLNTGKVLIAGGTQNARVSPNHLASAELYNPATGTFALTGSLTTGRYDQGSVLLNNGMVLITGGVGAPVKSEIALASAELYDPAAALFTSAGSMTGGSSGPPKAILLGNGEVLVVGDGPVNLYFPSGLIPAGLISLAVAPSAPTLSSGATQQFVATGTFSDGSTQTLQSVTWSSSNQAVATITNDATNHGVAFAVAVGQTIITATVGSISGSTALAVQ